MITLHARETVIKEKMPLQSTNLSMGDNPYFRCFRHKRVLVWKG